MDAKHQSTSLQKRSWVFQAYAVEYLDAIFYDLCVVRRRLGVLDCLAKCSQESLAYDVRDVLGPNVDYEEQILNQHSFKHQQELAYFLFRY